MGKKISKPKKLKNTEGIPLAVVSVNGGVCLLEKTLKKTGNHLFLSWSTDGLNFSGDKRQVEIKISPRKKEKIETCSNFSLSGTPTSFIMTYVRAGKTRDKDIFVIAKSKDLYAWTVKSEVIRGDSNQATVVYDKLLDLFILYKDGLFSKCQQTRTLTVWKESHSLLFTSRQGMFDSEHISIIGSLDTKDGLLVIYEASICKDWQTLLQIGGILFDNKDPKRIIWRSEAPLWQGVVELNTKSDKIIPIGFVYFQNSFLVYWTTSGGDLILSSFPSLFKDTDIYQYAILERFEKNPVIEPRTQHDWEVMGTFNPAVFQDEDGLHLFYRALGSDGISRIGYAYSKDGMHFDKRLPHPVFEPSFGLGFPDARLTTEPIGIHPAYYTSGGGWGGSEDPRVVKIDGDIYMSYVAFEGWNSVRVAITSIRVEDFKAGKWKWRNPKLISPEGEVHKNWVLFPEKINNKFAILHGIAPEILVDYIDSINDFQGYIKSPRPAGPQPGPPDSWDNILRGAGPPPLKTDLGWLLFYHAHGIQEPHKYKLGAMILDINEPSKILYRSKHSILCPDMHYENKGKPGVIYASGAVIKDGELRIYYGGGDRVVCIATTPLPEFLNYLKTGEPDCYELNKVLSRV
ncbi:MAG: hypothetical protein A3H52_01555 [Candidatus Zambryskibacteria bacterium RIFCSPLOWO2_02_FULL_39_26]|uniref:Glycosidase n=1 Tax=Candidatus Zambryskibacteria bacterium RIFCSPLOWO2_12_FULL_39_23 TaxID=1802776 RepID=A0A1G2URJ3_9BACT|nr:MAG: hypothetical protein A2W51_02580 [Candidatus Zambryskibacteria bacterium RIFCSPHIGHO2_02_39_10]OHA99308.1 MAG: hypothetical protein A3E59_00305 [Candidatus Zambryskibacteria bacterium RIFCSPHIGHO2_12_FULL_39_47]OHB10437.1 MAG: hypothetical protein A3H52_01555 [Candidatus Zambryskibacteria bacterium RIFCSPLOWO2_02_FULL_39_26]OHB12008.1 MAG: hypothetical protein A3G99_02900 [Candidatus Zambryskibacteria bacterium RIFCSPLOWO2_12_FULL_39_23]